MPHDEAQHRAHLAARRVAARHLDVRDARNQRGASAQHANPRRPGRHLRRLHRGAYRHAHTCPRSRPRHPAYLVRALRHRYRLHHARSALLRQPKYGHQPGRLAVLGRCAHDRDHGVFAQPRPARQLQVHARHRRRHSFALADDPRHRPGNLRQPHLAACRRILLPTRRNREDHYRALPCRLPCAEPRDALGVHLACGPVPLARHPHAPAAASHVGRGNAHRRVREGPRQRARVLPRVPGHALRCHGKEVLPGHRLGSCCHRRCRSLLRLRPRADACRHLA